jgi:hypothetical protein
MMRRKTKMPVLPTALNASVAMTTATIAPSWMGVVLAIILGTALLITAFMVITNFRRFIYGLGVAVPIFLAGWLSWGVTKPVTEGNWKPFVLTFSIIGGIALLTLIGKFLEGTKKFKDFEKKYLK